MSKLSEVHVVRYYESWIEDNRLYIQIELCSDNLKNIIEEKSKCFERQSSEAMNSIEFYISCQLFRELLECVEYIHGLKPPIIHRDLKPQNILINYKPTNGRFLRLCDFGSAKEHEFNSMSHTEAVGTFGYCAPEVFAGFSCRGKSAYNTKADVYSLGKIVEKLFDLETDE